MKRLLETLDGYSRITVALSGIWLFVSNLIYFSGLGEIRTYSIDHPETNTELATWQVVWRFFTFNLEGAHPYISRSEKLQYPLQSLTFSSFDEYSFVGHAVFMFLPILYIWIAFAILHWVRSGFNSSKGASKQCAAPKPSRVRVKFQFVSDPLESGIGFARFHASNGLLSSLRRMSKRPSTRPHDA